MSELAKCLCLDLTNPLSGYSKDLPHLLRVLGLPSSKLTCIRGPSPLGVTCQETPEPSTSIWCEVASTGAMSPHLDEVAETAVLLFSDRCLERDSVLCDALDLTHLVYIHIDFSSQFSYCRLLRGLGALWLTLLIVSNYAIKVG